MKWRKLGVLLLVAVFLSVFVVGCKQEAKTPDQGTTTEKFKVGFIYVGSPGDAGWSYAQDQGRKYLEKEMPEVETLFLEKVPEGADAEKSIDQLVQDGCKVVFATSFGFGDAVLEIAKKYPDVVFMHCSGLNTDENVGTYFGRIYQMRYLSGIVAGKMTTNNNLGYVAAFPIPEVVRGINAFALGAQSVNPNVKVKVVWTNTWFDPAKEKEAAKGLLEAGADVIAQHQDTYTPQQAAEEAKKYSIGYNSDMHQFAPNANLTSPVWNWGPYYVKTVQSVMDKTWKSEAYWGGVDQGIVALAPLSDKVPADVKQLVTDKQEAIKNGSLYIFEGPLKAQDGTVKIKEGQKMTDVEMLSMDWFVAGVDGKIEAIK